MLTANEIEMTPNSYNHCLKRKAHIGCFWNAKKKCFLLPQYMEGLIFISMMGGGVYERIKTKK